MRHKKDSPTKGPLLDLNIFAFLFIHGIVSENALLGGRVTFLVRTDEKFHRFHEAYSRNKVFHVLDFVSALQQLCSMMLCIRVAGGGR